MCNQRGKTLWITFTPHTEMHTKLSLAPHLGKSDHNSILLLPVYKQKIKAGSTSDSIN
jgi:hypothetical protein